MRQINAWVDAKTVGGALLGIKLSTSDAARDGGDRAPGPRLLSPPLRSS